MMKKAKDAQLLPEKAPGTDSRAPSRAASASGIQSDDRYTVLLRKMDDLERIHRDEKKRHQAEFDRYKSQIAALTKDKTEQSDRLEKLKKQNEAYNLRIQELNKVSAAGQAELKEIRIKLRMSEHERAQLAGKQSDVGEMRKALQTMESKRKEDTRERDKKIAELERAVAAERKKREMLESCLQDIKDKADEEVIKLRGDAKRLQSQLEATRKESQQAISDTHTKAASREEDLMDQLEQCKVALSRVAEQYGHLASTTVLAKDHEALKMENVELKMMTLRLERKLANTEGQVTELAHLIRQTQEQNTCLRQQLEETEDEASFYADALRDYMQYSSHQDSTHTLLTTLAGVHADMLENKLNGLVINLRDCKTANDLHSMRNEDLERALDGERAKSKTLSEEVGRHLADRVAADTCLQRLRAELAEANQALAKEQVSRASAHQQVDKLQGRVTQLEEHLRDEVSRHKDAENREREAAKKLSAQLSMSKTAEEALNAEIEQLHLELADAARYQDAYYKLVDETEDLLARNNLAEEEADRLSKFNAEILGHHNPAQRIMYVDRIRKELADAKQKLVVCTRERDAYVANNDDLRHELGLYKSSLVPAEIKPRSQFTRISRAPLTTHSLNVENLKPETGFCTSTPHPNQRALLDHIIPSPGDMTLDELM
ncbi:hypothetical protein F5J12DRAFT_798878 [Pisolithus orientalis]|uniref:uncharacterized protein n=1 Tax=Pisolithus orientalis TaxID=936130 RepID=UPI0022258F5E|nr:uncharacterized protein F5J12DRAFT_798878 [Pisolithus orientalis]KAI6033129.1 hypothetical protein F5J12DRAFT_798878 [Pisolithus orientalis]